MPRAITIVPKIPRLERKKRVAAYARVSSGKDAIRTLKKQPEILQEWDDAIWTVMIEKAIIHRDGKIAFVFQNGTEIKVGA